MNRIARRILKALLVIVVILIALAVGIVLFLGPIIKTAAEKVGPTFLGVPITVEKVSVNVFSGSFGLKNLRVGNPADKGYSADPAFAMGELRVAVNLASLPGKGPIEIKEVTILDPQVSYEVVHGVSNIDAMLKKLQGGTPATGAVAQPATEAKPAEKKEARKVIIDRFEFRNGELSYRAAITLHKAIKVPLPPIVATDIGKSSNGASMEEALGKMFGEIANGVGKAVVGVTDAVGNGAKAGSDAVQSGAKAVKDVVKGLF